MSLARTIITEAWGLFVDDGPFAAAIVAWLALCWAALPRLALAPPWPALVLFAGLAAILVASAVRYSRHKG